MTKKMGFKLNYLKDGTIKGTLDLKEEMAKEQCSQPEKPEPPPEANKKKTLTSTKEQAEKETEQTEKETGESDTQPEAELTSL